MLAKSTKEKELLDAGARIREQALVRCRGKGDEEEAIELHCNDSSPPSPARKIRKRSTFVQNCSPQYEIPIDAPSNEHRANGWVYTYTRGNAAGKRRIDYGL